MAEDSKVDISYLRSISSGDDAFVVEMIELFLENTPGMLDRIEKCYENEDWKQLASVLHSFKPNLDYVGLQETKKIVEDLEVKAGNKNLPANTGELLKTVTERCEKAYAELNEMINELK